MCGIAGIWNSSGAVSKECLEKFTHSLKHRGPDGYGFFRDDSDRLGLGHRRLAILDLSETGKQPMQYREGRYWITYNGEIYNFIELREELEKSGYSFASQSDTEVIMAAYDRWGEECQERFNGMWAFALWDRERQELFLSRDRFGIKPLYYTYVPDSFFAFASETIAFKHLDHFAREFDKKNVTRVLNDVFCLEGSGQTIFKGIFQVRPGHQLVFSHRKGIVQKRWWYTLENTGKIPDQYPDQVKSFKALFSDSCSIRMRSDVPIGTALSGGVDSSSVYCMLHDIRKSDHLLKRVPEDWQKAFILSFPGSGIDEKEYARTVIDYTGGVANYLVPDFSRLVEDLCRTTREADYIYNSPPVGHAIYQKMAESRVKVSLDGHGVDEMLLGYPHLVADAYITAKILKKERYAEEILEIFANLHAIESRERARLELRKLEKQFYRRRLWKKYINFLPGSMQSFIINMLRKMNGKSGEKWLIHPEYLDEGTGSDIPPEIATESDKSLYMNFHHTLLPTILRNFDRASMKSGVEIRMPFMDWRLVSLVFGLPLESKIGGGQTKRILRDAMIHILPESIRTRTLKIGLNAPMTEWFSHEMRDFIWTEVNSKEFLGSDIWDGPAIRNFVLQMRETGSWTWEDCLKFWPYLNAHILMKGEA